MLYVAPSRTSIRCKNARSLRGYGLRGAAAARDAAEMARARTNKAPFYLLRAVDLPTSRTTPPRATSFRRYGVATEHEVWLSDGTTARPGRVTAIDDDGRCAVVDEEGDKHKQLKREHICEPVAA